MGSQTKQERSARPDSPEGRGARPLEERPPAMLSTPTPILDRSRVVEFLSPPFGERERSGAPLASPLAFPLRTVTTPAPTLKPPSPTLTSGAPTLARRARTLASTPSTLPPPSRTFAAEAPTLTRFSSTLPSGSSTLAGATSTFAPSRRTLTDEIPTLLTQRRSPFTETRTKKGQRT